LGGRNAPSCGAAFGDALAETARKWPPPTSGDATLARSGPIRDTQANLADLSASTGTLIFDAESASLSAKSKRLNANFTRHVTVYIYTITEKKGKRFAVGSPRESIGRRAYETRPQPQRRRHGRACALGRRPAQLPLFPPLGFEATPLPVSSSLIR